MSLKIGIVTYNFSPNVGASIQSYALKFVLERMGHSVHHIQKDPTVRDDRHKLFADFCNEHLNFAPPSDDFDLIIVGSDQVWSKIKKLESYYFANFSKTTMKASYAASLARTNLNLPGLRLFFERNLRGFDFISIREPKFKNAIEEITKTDVEVHIDPSLLLDDIHYMPFVKPRPVPEEYVCTHYHAFGHKAPALQVLVEKIQQEKGLSVAHNLVDVELDNVVLDYSGVGVEDIITTVYHSSFVVTNSFHGLALSIIFKKDFLVVVFGELSAGVNERVYNLCSLLGLTDRIVNLPTPNKFECLDISPGRYKNFKESINWVDVTKRLYTERKHSFDYLYNVTEGTRRAKRDYLVGGDSFSCYGCAACGQKCPTNAIDMVQDGEGFFFPKIDRAKCVDCNLCTGVCPHNTKKPIYTKPLKCYLTYHKDDAARVNSSSGGVFAAMAERILATGGFVVGVKFDDSNTAVYDIVDNADDCYKLRYSKYVEAQDNNIYIKTKEALKTGRNVLFTGTPCKIAGLTNYLDGDYDNLYLADIICRGTNSPLILKKHLEERASGRKLKHFQFRSPKSDNAWSSAACEYVYDDGTVEIVHKRQDLFMKYYTKGFILKRSCYTCEFCKSNGVSDITFGDFWGYKGFYNGEDIEKGLSCIKVNTAKGQRFVNELNLYLQPQKTNEIYRNNHKNPVEIPFPRGALFKWVNDGESLTDVFDRAVKEM